MQISHKLDATTAVRGPQLRRTSTLGVVTLVDATGYEHPLLVEYCTSFQVRTRAQIYESYQPILFSN